MEIKCEEKSCEGGKNPHELRGAQKNRNHLRDSNESCESFENSTK